jgi:magnesium transporter
MMVASSVPQYEPVSFIFTTERVITLRYIDTLAFQLCSIHIQKPNFTYQTAMHLFIELLNSITDRLADILEIIEHQLDHYSQILFHGSQNTLSEKIDYNQLLRHLGSIGELSSKAGDSLSTFTRLMVFFAQKTHIPPQSEMGINIASIIGDLKSLSEHMHFLSTKIHFYLEATLGMISIEQNSIIKIFSIAAVIFLPPTLIATIYGMNFKNMPELSWSFGYPLVLITILLTAWLPYRYVKKRKWI